MADDRPLAVVTGAAQGIGAGIARRLAADGYFVVLLDVDQKRATGVAEEIGGRAIQCDVGKPDAVRAAAAEFGPAHILVNNAGIWITKSLLECADDELRAVVDVNLLGVAHCCRAFGPGMIAQGVGSIVNVSSGAVPTVPSGFGVYPSTKAGVEALTRQLAIEWGRFGIRVNAVGPGAIQTERNVANFQGDILEFRLSRIPLRRTGWPADIADVVSALCSHDMRYVTGQIIYIDGGATAGGGAG